MSAFAYGALTAQRKAVREGTSKDEEAPGFGSYLDVVAALVPAEILAANAALLPLMTSTGTDDDGNAITTITDPGTLKVVFWLSIVFSALLFVVGDRGRAKKAALVASKKAGDGKKVETVSWGGWDYLRALIPAAAYVIWVMLQKSTAFDAIEPDMNEALRLTIAVFGAIALGVFAKSLSDKADNSSPPDPVPVEDPSETTPATAGSGLP